MIIGQLSIPGLEWSGQTKKLEGSPFYVNKKLGMSPLQQHNHYGW